VPEGLRPPAWHPFRRGTFGSGVSSPQNGPHFHTRPAHPPTARGTCSGSVPVPLHLIGRSLDAQYLGDPEARKKERREKLERGRKRRELINRARQQKAA